MEKNVARLKEEIKKKEEEISDRRGRSESTWKAAEELRKQLKAAEEKLAKAKGAESTGTLLIAFLARKQPIDASATNVCLCGTVAFVLVASVFTAYRRRTVNIDQRPLLSEEA
jgi:DNA repair exonuclease SbcCD ATPase subunit